MTYFAGFLAGLLHGVLSVFGLVPATMTTPTLPQLLPTETQTIQEGVAPSSAPTVASSIPVNTNATDSNDCAAYTGLKQGDTDATTGGLVSKLQEFLGISPVNGTYGPRTNLAYQNICVGGNSQPTSVPGMSRYTDSTFGFSFWYPSSWRAGEVPPIQTNQFGGSVENQIQISDGNTTIDLYDVQANTITLTAGAQIFDTTTSYNFDTNKGEWMKVYPNELDSQEGAPMTQAQIVQSKMPSPVDLNSISNTMGGLHEFPGGDRETVVVPLSAQHFVVVSGGPAYDAHTYLANTIVATDPSTALPVPTAQQVSIIQAEVQAYGVSSGSSSSGTWGFSATPISGRAPLTVSFTANHQAENASIDFGDGRSAPVLQVAEGSPSTDLYFNHTYATPGTYAVNLVDILSGEPNASVAITVTN